MINTGIIGGAGYTAGELIRLLVNHPGAEIVSVVSNSHAGEVVHVAHPDLEDQTDLVFDAELSGDLDVVFLCSGHGKSKGVVESGAISEGVKIIDLSSDFRIKSDDHDFIYGLPELNKSDIQKAHFVANPGCFATCIQLGLLPLAKAGLLKQDVHVSAITGSTGAGQSPTDTTHFSWRSNNASVYKPLRHQHLAEIRQNLQQLQDGFKQQVHFIPMRGAFTRGILAASYLQLEAGLDEVKSLYEGYYAEHPFVTVTESNPDVKRVVNTNKGLVYLTKENGQVLIISVIDNLLKGASGQAVQNMNLMFGLNETEGLILKSSAF